MDKYPFVLLKYIAPKAYRPNKKKSRIFKLICGALGVTNETVGSKFQKFYAHFVTMSNPKEDTRGNEVTVCESCFESYSAHGDKMSEAKIRISGCEREFMSVKNVISQSCH